MKRRIFLVIISFFLLAPMQVFALTQDQLNALQYDGEYYLGQPTGSLANSCGPGVTNLTGNGNIQQAYNYFISVGFTPNQAAGIVGNLWYESGGVNPTQGQKGGGGGYGIAQFTGAKLAELKQWSAANGLDYTTLKAQLNFLWYDINTNEQQVLRDVKSTTTVQDAVLAWQGNQNVGGPYIGYERPADESASVQQRTDDANATLTLYGNSVTGSSAADSGGCVTASANGCVNPFAKIKGLGPERIDMGVDYAAPAGSPILAMCDAKVIGAASGGTGWVSPTNTQACVYLELTGGPYTGKTYYVCEDIKPTVTTGQVVTAGTQIATFLPSGTGIETGWGSGTPYGALAAELNQECTNGDPGCWSSAAGVSFNKFLLATGAQGGVFVPGAPPQTMPPGYP